MTPTMPHPPTLPHGARVRFDVTLFRATFHRPETTKTGQQYTARWRVWTSLRCRERTGLLIGYRTLRDGTTDWVGEEAGYVFTPRDTPLRVALVSPSLRHKPVYVPLDALREEPAS